MKTTTFRIVMILAMTALSVPLAHADPSPNKLVEGKWTKSPKGQLVAFLRVPDKGETELWVRHTRDGSTTLLRRGELGVSTANIRKVKLAWEGRLIRLESQGKVCYFDLRGRRVSG